jgi:hypothetical protein
MCNFAKLETLVGCPDWSTGLGSTIKIGYSADFSATPTPAVIPALGVITNVDLATSTGTYTTASVGKGFIEMDVDDINRDFDIQEETDANGAITLTIKAKVLMSKDALGFKKKLKPRTKILMVIPKPHGESLQIGYKGFEAFVDKNTVMESSKESHISFEFKCYVGMSILPAATIFPAQV